MSLLQDYGGSFEPEFSLERLDRSALGRLGREYMLFAHLHDRGIMPLVGSRFGGKAMTDLALDEWMGASPVYNRNMSCCAYKAELIQRGRKFKGLHLYCPTPCW